MPAFDSVTAAEAQALIQPPAWLDANRLFAGIPTAKHPEGWVDHWQEGCGYAGPMPDPTDPNGAWYSNLLGATYVTEDCISDAKDRESNGVLGKEPGYSYQRIKTPEEVEAEKTAEETPNPTERDAEIERVQAVVSEWWDVNGVHGLMKRFEEGLCVAGSPLLRLYVPYGLLDSAADGTRGFAQGTTPEDVLRILALDVLYPDQAAVYEDPATRLDLGVVEFGEEEPEVTAEGAQALPLVELTYLDSAKPGALTVIRTINSADKGDRWQGDLRGALPVYQARATPTITEGVRSNQIDLNTTRTMAAISNHYAGFPSLYFTNAKPPTQTVSDGAGGTVDVPASVTTGPAQVGFFVGHEGEDGKTLPVGIHRLDPVNNANLRESATEAREAVYRLCKQFHVLALTGAAISGDAMVQAQGEFLNALMDRKAEVDRAGKWLLETVWAFAQALAGVPVDKDLRCVFDCRVSAGPLPSALRARILAEYEAGLHSWENAVSLLGTDDVEAARSQIAKERAEVLAGDPAAVLATNADAFFRSVPSGDGTTGAVPDLTTPAE